MEGSCAVTMFGTAAEESVGALLEQVGFDLFRPYKHATPLGTRYETFGAKALAVIVKFVIVYRLATTFGMRFRVTSGVKGEG